MITQPVSFQKNNPKITHAWTMYDWANSAFSLVIASAVFPAYYEGVARRGPKDPYVSLGSLEIKNTVLQEYSISIAFLIIALLSPMLTAMADYSGRKKGFMQFFCVLGSLGCISMFLFDSYQTLFIGLAGYIIGLIGFSGSIVFNNAYLADIATPDRYDRLSARGFAMGYIGSILLLIVSLVIITQPSLLGITSGTLPSRISFLMTGIWWFGFAQYSFYYMPANVYGHRPQGNILLKGYQELRKVFDELKQIKVLKRFLLAYFFYNMAVQTVMYVAPNYGKEEIKLETPSLIITILIIQGVAVVGAYFFSYLSKIKGNIFSLSVAVIIWIGICIGAYLIKDALSFFIIAAFVGWVMGGIQALSRATYAKLIPPTEDTASYFSFYDVSEKIGIVLGTFVFALIHQFYSIRESILALMIFFIIGLVFLYRVQSNSLKPSVS